MAAAALTLNIDVREFQSAIAIEHEGKPQAVLKHDQAQPTKCNCYCGMEMPGKT
jgi:hypothetical protein